MDSRQLETRLIEEIELDAIAGGRVCNHGPPRWEVSIQFGPDVLVVWATSTCSGSYWYTK